MAGQPAKKEAIARGRAGLTGLETAIILIAFVIVASAFAFTILNVGFQSTQKSQEVIRGGLEEASSVIELDGAVIAKANTTSGTLDNITFVIKLSAGKQPVDLNQDKLVISWFSEKMHVTNIYDGIRASVTPVFSGDTDMFLKYGDKYQVFIDVSAIGDTLRRNDLFKVELKPVIGAVMTIERRLPPALEPVMFLG